MAVAYSYLDIVSRMSAPLALGDAPRATEVPGHGGRSRIRAFAAPRSDSPTYFLDTLHRFLLRLLSTVSSN